MKMKKVAPIVQSILLNNPKTRNSDTVLYEAICIKINPNVENMSFSEVMLNRDMLGLPKYNSVSRVRRKLQRDHEELRATKEVTDKRYENWKEVRDYVQE